MFSISNDRKHNSTNFICLPKEILTTRDIIVLFDNTKKNKTVQFFLRFTVWTNFRQIKNGCWCISSSVSYRIHTWAFGSLGKGIPQGKLRITTTAMRISRWIGTSWIHDQGVCLCSVYYLSLFACQDIQPNNRLDILTMKMFRLLLAWEVKWLPLHPNLWW